MHGLGIRFEGLGWGKAPAIFQPRDLPQAAEWIRRQAQQGSPFLIGNSGRHWFFGDSPQPVDAILSVRALDRVVDYSPADLTISLEAGCTIGQIARLLADKGQELPFCRHLPSQTSIGGAVAVGLESLESGALEGARDALIGIQVVQPEGISRAGGGVVKNVAGYDLCKLYVGSLGGLGLLARLTFKLRPLAPASAALSLGCGSLEEALESGLRVESLLTPTGLQILPRRAWAKIAGGGLSAPTEGDWILCWGMRGSQEVLEAQVHRCATCFEGLHKTETGEHDRIWSSLQGMLDPPSSPELATLLIAGPAQKMSAAVAALREALGDCLPSVALRRRTLIARVPAAGLPTALAPLRRMLASLSCRALVWSAPEEAKRGLDVLGMTPWERSALTRLKAAIDPHGVVNPGRL